MTTDNNPNVILTLVAHGQRAHDVWADPHNESFYIPPLSQATLGEPREVVVSPGGCFRELTPTNDNPDLNKASEPALQITFGKKPKNPELGYLLGSDRESCDIFLGSLDDYISPQMFAISFNQYDEVIMKSSSRNKTVVTYGTQFGERRNFAWIFPPGQKNVSVNAANTINFSVKLPTHETDKAAYQANCRNFMKLADSASHTMNLLSVSSRPDTRLASGALTPDATVEPPFYLRTGQIGYGGSGVVDKVRSMPDGATVAVKHFKSKNPWTLEADVLRKLSRTPHENIVKFIGFGLGVKPFLVMGLALGGNLEEQYRIMPFTIREIGLILRQMLNALVYLHEDFHIIHRNIKPANILCDSRAHFRLADFGLAKEEDSLQGFKETQACMAPEMYFDMPYTTAVDLWALGVVITWLVSPNGSSRHKRLAWCAAVVANFKKYEECFQAIGSNAPEQRALNLLVGQHMLRMRPEDRESAPGCLDRGTFLWQLLDQESEPEDESEPEEESGPNEESGPSKENGSSGDDSSEAGSEISEARILNSDDWLSLERQFPINERNGAGNGEKTSFAQHFIHAPSVNSSRNVSEDLTTLGSNGHSGANPTQHNEAANGHKQASQGSRLEFPAAPMGVRKPILSNSNTESIAAAAAQQAAEEQSQREGQASLDEYRRQTPGMSPKERYEELFMAELRKR